MKFTPAITAVVLSLLAGCATYERQPLAPAAIERALTAPALADVKTAAAKLAHPLLPPIIIDGRDGFSPDEIAVMVVIVSPQLRALRAQRGVARAQVLQAGILPNPQLGYTVDKPRGNADPALINGKNLGLSWEVTSLLGQHDRIAGARATADALDLAIAWQEWTAAQDARLRAFRLLALRSRLPLLREAEHDYSEIAAASKLAADRGHRTLVELTAATEQWLAAQTARSTAEQDYAAERTALNLALGQSADTEVPLKPSAEFPEFPADLAAASLLDGIEKRRLDLVALGLGYESQEAGVRAAVKAQFPKIVLGFSRANDTSDVRTRSFGVTIDLPVFDRSQGAIAIAKATRQQLFDEYVARVAEARSTVGLILGKLAATRAQLQATAAALPQLEQLEASFAKALQTRNADVLAARDARSLLIGRRLEQDNLRQQLVELGVALEIATGRPLLNHRSAP